MDYTALARHSLPCWAANILRPAPMPPHTRPDPNPVSVSPAADEASDISPHTVLESMLFVGRPDNQPLTAEQLAGLMRGVNAQEVETIIAELNARYTCESRPYEIIAKVSVTA